MKSKNRYLGGFNTAPDSNRLALLGRAALPKRTMSPAEQAAVRYRADVAREIGGATCPYDELRQTDADNWGQLVKIADTWLEQLIPSDESVLNDTRYSILQAAHQGIYTIKAFLEVVPKVIKDQTGIESAVYSYAAAKASAGFINEWAGLDGEVDPRLAWALSLYEPRNRNVIFEGLTFDPSKFIFDPNSLHLSLNPDTHHRLRDYHKRHPSDGQQSQMYLWGCPAIQMIPRLYGAMAEVAYTSGLLGGEPLPN